MKKTVYTVLFLILLLIMTSCSFSPKEAGTMLSVRDNLIVHFLDVGQADSILIQLPNGEISLIDGGNRDDSNLVVSYIKNQGIDTIDYLVATHPHEDHIGGLAEVVKSFKIGKVYMPRVAANTKTYENLLLAIKDKGLKITQAKAGVEIIADNTLRFTILAPASEEYGELNEYSAVAKLSFKDVSFLFTGDAEKLSEKEMLDSGFDLNSNVLKVGHHGGRSSSTKDFINSVNPDYAVISVGKGNDYGHPHEEALKRLEERNAEILRTDVHGNIVMKTDGSKINIVNQLGEPQGETTVYVTQTGKKYHKEGCSSLSESKKPIKLQDAKAEGYTPCSKCKPAN